MLTDMIRDLCNSKTAREQEHAFHRLEKAGVDRRTALLLARELNREEKKNEQHGN